MPAATDNQRLIASLNDALGWEFRAQMMYAHYAAYVQGIYRLHLKPFFDVEATESIGHANIVRDHIVKLGGVAGTERDKTEIVHTSDYRIMLKESMQTETRAAALYKEFLSLPGIESELHDAIEQIYFQEERSVDELTQLLAG